MWIVHFLNLPIDSIKCFVPTPNFLSDVAAFEAVFIALAVPLSVEVVSRYSDRFSSEVAANQFNKEWEIRLLPWFIIPNIVLAVTLRFSAGETTSSFWNVMAWVVFFGFILVALLLFIFIKKLIKYTSDTEYILGRLYEEAERSLEE